MCVTFRTSSRSNSSTIARERFTNSIFLHSHGVYQVTLSAKRVRASHGPSTDAEGESGVVRRGGHVSGHTDLVQIGYSGVVVTKCVDTDESKEASRSIKQTLLGKKPPTEISKYEGSVVEVRFCTVSVHREATNGRSFGG